MNIDNVLKIKTPDDSQKEYTTYITFDGFNLGYNEEGNYRPKWGAWRYRYNRSNVINPNHYRNKHEPTIYAIKAWLENKLELKYKGRGDFVGTINFHLKENIVAKIHFSKNNSRYFVQGMQTPKDTAITAISRTIYRSCFETDSKILENYCFNNILLPENVSYAIENRAPYHWYLKGIKVDVRFNVQMIGPDMCAMEISDGIWAPINVKKMNTYMNYYWKGLKSSSWFKSRLTPKKLWIRLLKTEPTESQEAMMIAFLQQNRTDALVQERAYQLVSDMAKQYPNRIKVFWEDKIVKAIAVKGKVADWIITDNQYKTDIQAVSTYLFYKGDTSLIKSNSLGGILKGPICIDNMTKNSSVGDQFAARVFALLNDKVTIEIVSTIKHYLDETHYEGQMKNRLDFDKITLENVLYYGGN